MALAEISVVGNEASSASALFMAVNHPSRAIVAEAATLRLIGQQLKDEFRRNGEVQFLLLRYTRP